MFDPKKPYNDIPQLPPKCDFDDIEILKKVNKANIALSKLEAGSIAIPNRTLLIEPLSVREAVASSGIENINTTVAEVFQAELFANKEVSKEQKETLHYKAALRLGYSLIKKNSFLNTNSFLQIQSILEPDQSGIRKLPGTSIINSTTGEIRYTPPEGEAIIRDLLGNYETYYNDFTDDVDPLIKMAVLHYQFEAIHPFYDGNGRTGRILMILYLILAKILELPILFISGYINAHRAEYYELLRAVDSKEGWKEWILFILNAVEIQANETHSTIVKIKELQDSYKESIKAKLPKIYSADLVEALFVNPFYNQEELAKKLDIHNNTAAKYLNALLQEGFIDSFKHKTSKIYFNPKFLALLS
jgi:Fic family protein